MLYRALLISFFFTLPSFAEDSSNYGLVPDFSFKNLAQEDITPRDLQGKYWLLNFFFTSCPKICPAINGRVATLHYELAEKKNLSFISVSIDPERDTSQALKKYAKKFGADAKQWQLLRGEKAAVRKLIDDLHLLASEELDKHTTRLILVGPDGGILKFYRALDGEDFKLLRSRLAEL